MRSATWHGAILMSIMGCACLSSLDHMRRGERVAHADEITGSLQPHGGRGATLALSEVQRDHIYRGVMELADSPRASEPAPDLAQRVPNDVPLHDLPAAVGREIPLIRSHKFLKFDDRILLVDPASRTVVAMIPRYKVVR